MADATLVYDDDCGFCTWWAQYIAVNSDTRLVGFSELGDDLRDRLPAEYENCSHLVVDDEVYSCGASIEEALVRSDVADELRPVVEQLRQFGGYRWLRERVYRFVEENRDLFGKIVSTEPPARKD